VPLAAALLVAGCGSTVTKHDVVVRANAICANTLRSVRAVPPPTVTTLASLEAYYGRVAPIVESEVTQLQKLPRPAQDKQVLDKWVSSMAMVGSDYRALLKAAQMHNKQGISEALGSLQASHAANLAARYGLRVCTGSEGTTVAN
jgi:hypothetical protein